MLLFVLLVLDLRHSFIWLWRYDLLPMKQILLVIARAPVIVMMNSAVPVMPLLGISSLSCH